MSSITGIRFTPDSFRALFLGIAFDAVDYASSFIFQTMTPEKFNSPKYGLIPLYIFILKNKMSKRPA